MQRQRAIELARDAMVNRRTMAERETGYIFHHGLRVSKLSLSLADAVDEQVDVSREVLEIGALLHDVGKGRPSHHEAGASLVPAILEDVCDPEEIEQVAGLVRMHNRRDRRRCSVAQRVVQDADMLDHFGAQNVWLAFHWNAAHDDPPEEWVTYYLGEQNRTYTDAARAALNFSASIDAFERRLTVEQRFLDDFRRELRGDL